MLMSWLKAITVLLALATVTSCQWWSYNNQFGILTKDDVPLPKSVKPTNYQLKIYPKILEGYFFGKVLINITCEEPTENVILHAHPELNISHVYIMNGEEEISIKNITRDDHNETISLLLGTELQVNGLYQIHFDFNGTMNTENEYARRGLHQPMGGLYRGSYMDPDSTSKKWYVITNMAPKSARRVFPCFDEPSFKATYQISVAHFINMIALSVTPIESTDPPIGDGVWDNFEITPPISTFSVNFFIGDFENNVLMSTPSSENDLTLSYYHRQLQYLDNITRSQLNNLQRQFEYLQEYLGVKYPLPKLDIVGIPGTEYYLTSSSPGLILTNEYKMTDRFTDKIRDLADQWFLHIVTPEKWNDFYMTDIMSHYLGTSMDNVGINTMPLYYLKKEVIYEIFSFNMDRYGGFATGQENNIIKGSWFLEMLNSSLTENTMRTAFRNIISNNMYSTYTREDFWAEITKSAHIDGTLPKKFTVEMLADRWLNSNVKLFPVLTVTRNYDNDTAFVEQHIFTKKINQSLTEEEKEMLWPIPITYLTPCRQKTSAVHPVAWIQEQNLVINNLPDADALIIVNPTDSGMFLVNYDERNWDLLVKSLRASEPEIPTLSRKKVLKDALYLAAGGELSYGTALNMTIFLLNETDHSVWLPFLQHITQLQSICHFTTVEDKLNIYIRELVGPLYTSMSQPDYQTQSYDYITFWYKAKDVLQRVGYQPCINEQNKYISVSVATFSYYDNDTQLTLYCPESLTNISDDFSNYTNQLGQFVQYRDYSLMGICKCPGFNDLAQRILNGTLNEDRTFLSYEFNNLVQLVTACQQSYNKTVDYFVENFDELRHRFYFVKDMWNVLVNAVFNKMRTQDQLDRLTALFEEKERKFGYSRPNVRRAIEEAKTLIKTRESSLSEIEVWFDVIWPSVKNALL